MPKKPQRRILSQKTGFFGVTELNNFRLYSQKDVAGGQLVRFQQTFNGIPVIDGGIGVVMKNNNASSHVGARCFATPQ